MFWALTSVTLSLTHTLRQPLNNSIHFSSSLEFWVTTVVKWRWKGNKNMKCSDFQYIFSLSLGKNYTIMSFSWCAHQWNWKPHLSSFGLIEKSEFREFSWAVSILCCQVEQLKEGSKNTGLKRVAGPWCHCWLQKSKKRSVPWHSDPIC